MTKYLVWIENGIDNSFEKNENRVLNSGAKSWVEVIYLSSQIDPDEL